MVAGIELGKEYAQVCVKTASMKDAESVSLIAGSESYRIPTEGEPENQEQLQSFFRKLWKLVNLHGGREELEVLVFCLEDNRASLRESLSEILQIYNIPLEKVRFLDKKECFCAYVFHQSAELFTHSALLIENLGGKKEKLILQKRTKTAPVVTEVRNISEKPLEKVFTDHGISSVFLVGDDFEEEWMQKNLRILKNGRRIFAGKNLYVKGACYRGMELVCEKQDYIYLGEQKLACHVALKTEAQGAEQFVTIVEGGKDWYDSGTVLEVLLTEGTELEFAMIPLNGKEKKTIQIHLEGLPDRPEMTTRLQIELTFTGTSCAKLTVKDLGFGEFFAPSDMIYEGELRWEQ